NTITTSLGAMISIPVSSLSVPITIADFNQDGLLDIAVLTRATISSPSVFYIYKQVRNTLEGKYTLKSNYTNPANPTVSGNFSVTDGSIELRTVGANKLAMYWNGLEAHPISNAGTLSYLASQQPVYDITGSTINAVQNSFTAGQAFSLVAGYNHLYNTTTKTIYTKYAYNVALPRTYTDTLTYQSALEFNSASFEQGYMYVLIERYNNITSADIDGDRKPEIILNSSTTNRLTVLRNQSSISTIDFAVHQDFTTGGATSNGMTTADIDGDNKLDILTANGSDNTISILLNTSTVGSVALAAPVNISAGAGAYRIAVGDLNGDNIVDVSVVNTSAATVSVLKNNSTIGSLALSAAVDFPVGALSGFLTLGDMDLDGKLDIVTVSQTDNNFSVLRSKFSEPTLTSFSPLFGTTGEVITLTGTNFTGTTQVKLNGSPAASFTVINDQTITAVVGGGSTGSISVENDCGTSSKTGFVFTGMHTIVDCLPKDGPIGTLVTITGTNFNTNPNLNLVYFGTVQATVISATATSMVVRVPLGAVSAPIKIVINTVQVSSTFNFVITTAGLCNAPITNKTFAAPINYPVPGESWMIATGDIDGDQKADIAYCNWNANELSIYRNSSTTGSIQLDTRFDLIAGEQPDDVVIADLDGDGKQDLITVNSNSSENNLSVFRNLSTPSNILLAP
ncbi:MAG: FG-GAP-like repeat-containing protein, partial [Ferruginibacter sp.]